MTKTKKIRQIYEQNEAEITLNMWGVSESTIRRFRKNCAKNIITKFCNGMTYNPETKIFK